jgi:hypothetical protein
MAEKNTESSTTNWNNFQAKAATKTETIGLLQTTRKHLILRGKHK